MGLDGVELIMEIEYTFGVRIEDAEAEKCLHPSDVIELVWSKVKHAEQSLCSSQRAFYLTRRALVEVFGVERSRIKPDSLVSDFVPEDNQPENWARLRDAVRATSWPELVRPAWLSNTIGIVVVLVSIGVAIWAEMKLSDGWVVIPVSIIGAGIITGGVLSWISNLWKNRIPMLGSSVQELSEWAYSSERMEWTREAVAETVKKIVMDVLGIAEKKYSEDASFVEDYGI